MRFFVPLDLILAQSSRLFELTYIGMSGQYCSMDSKQTKIDGEVKEIWLTVHQFSTIFNHEKHIVREALGTE